MKVLIIEDNNILRDNVKKYLEIQWIEVDTHSEYNQAINKIINGNFDVIILDIGLWADEWNGIDICKEVRIKWNNVPILMLTARTLTRQKIEGLNSWSDDYMEKPFDYWELLARINTLARRNDSLKWEIIEVWDIKIDLVKMIVNKSSKQVDLSKLEYNLLLYLCQNKWRVLSKNNIIEKVWWEIDLFKENRNVDIYVWYLRKKLWKTIIQTIRGVWYTIN